MVTLEPLVGLTTLAVASGLVLVSGVTAVLLGGLLSVCAVTTVVLLLVAVIVVSCGVDGFAGVAGCCC